MRSKIGSVIGNLISVEGLLFEYPLNASLIMSVLVGSGKDEMRCTYPITDTKVSAVDAA